MSLTLNANWLAAFRRGSVDVRFLIRTAVEDPTPLSITNQDPTVPAGGTKWTTSAAHGRAVGDWVKMENLSGAASTYEGIFQVTVVNSSTQFETAYPNTLSPSTYTADCYTRVIYNWLTGDHDTMTYPASAGGIQPINRSLDPIERGIREDQNSVVFARDGLMDYLLSERGLRGRTFEIRIGTAQLAESDFEYYYVGTCEDHRITDGSVLLNLKAIETQLADAVFTPGAYKPYNIHPLTALKDTLGTAYYEEDSFDWEAADNLDISHWVVSRVGVKGYYEDRNVDGLTGRDVAEGLTKMIPGTLGAREDGRLRFKRFDPGTPDDHWTQNDYSDLRTVASTAKLANRITVKTHSYAGAWAEDLGKQKTTQSFKDAYQLDDTYSQRRCAQNVPSVAPGAGAGTPPIWSTARIIEQVLGLDWLSGYSFLSTAVTDVSPGVGGNIYFSFGEVFSMVGTQWPKTSPGPWPNGTQNSNAQLSDTRTGYIRVDDEIIEVDRTIALDGWTSLQTPWYPDTVFQFEFDPSPNEVTYRVKTRGALGTTAAAHSAQAEARDVTIAVHIAQILAERMTNGLWQIECRTDLSKFDLQVGDIVTLDNEEFAAFGVTSLDSDTSFELVQKRVEPYAEQPSILWTLAYAGQTSPPSTNFSERWWTDLRGSLQNKQVNQNRGGSVSVPKPTSGSFTFTDDGGLVCTIGSGDVDYLTGRSGTTEDTELTLFPNGDNYIAWDTYTERICFSGPLGSPPDWPTAALLWKITTNATDITASQDLRGVDIFADGLVKEAAIAADSITNTHVKSTAAIAGSKLGAGSGALANLDNSGNLDFSATHSNKTLDNINDGSSYARIAASGVTSSTVNSLGIYPAAVGTHQMAGETMNRNHNFDFNLWTRG